MSDLAAGWAELDAEHVKRWAWFDGPRISFDDVNRGTGAMQRISVREVFGGGRVEESTAAKATGQRPLVITFGQYRGRLAVDVREENPRYWKWLMEQNWFRGKAAAAGLLDDENDHEEAAA